MRCIHMANITAVYADNTNYYQNGTTVPVPAVPVPAVPVPEQSPAVPAPEYTAVYPYCPTPITSLAPHINTIRILLWESL